MHFEEMEPMGQAGVLLGLIGGVLGLVPQLERVLTGFPGWEEALILSGLAAAMLIGSILALKEYIAIGGLLTGVFGLAFGVFGPTMPGVLGVLAGVLLFLHAGELQEDHEARREEEPSAKLDPETARG